MLVLIVAVVIVVGVGIRIRMMIMIILYEETVIPTMMIGVLLVMEEKIVVV